MIPEYADLIGKPYKLSGRGPDSFDCYGLVIEMNRRAGIIIPDVISIAGHQDIENLINEKKRNWTECEIKPGATIIFKIKGYGAHVGYVVSPTRFIHTWEGTGGVTVERISLWKQRILGVYEYVF